MTSSSVSNDCIVTNISNSVSDISVLSNVSTVGNVSTVSSVSGVNNVVIVCNQLNL